MQIQPCMCKRGAWADTWRGGPCTGGREHAAQKKLSRAGRYKRRRESRGEEGGKIYRAIGARIPSGCSDLRTAPGALQQLGSPRSKQHSSSTSVWWLGRCFSLQIMVGCLSALWLFAWRQESNGPHAHCRQFCFFKRYMQALFSGCTIEHELKNWWKRDLTQELQLACLSLSYLGQKANKY